MHCMRCFISSEYWDSMSRMLLRRKVWVLRSRASFSWSVGSWRVGVGSDMVGLVGGVCGWGLEVEGLG